MKVAPLIAVTLVICIAFPGSIQAKKKPKPNKFCIGKDGNQYAEGEGYDDNDGKACVHYKCVKKNKKKFIMKQGKCERVDGEWGDWSSWSDCSATCGSATKKRTRTCSNPKPSNGGKPCRGQDTEVEECSLKACGPVENVNVTAMELNLQSLNDTVQAMLELISTMQSTANKQGTCLSDLSSSECPASAEGKVGVVDGIAANTADISTNTAGLVESKAGIATNQAGVATNQAGVATNQAGIATNQAGVATNQAGVATNQEDITSNNDTCSSIQATATKIETCLGDVNSVSCPSSKEGKTSVPDAIMKNTDAVQNHHSEWCPGTGSGWTLVRSVPPGAVWHPAVDQLRGTEKYGNPNDKSEAFSVMFDQEDFDQFLFSTGDCEKWLIARKEQVIGEEGNAFYANEERNIMKSSTSESSYKAKWYRREGVLEDPWISLTDHTAAIGKNDILYGENSFEGQNAGVLNLHNGARVFIRKDATTTITTTTTTAISSTTTAGYKLHAISECRILKIFADGSELASLGVLSSGHGATNKSGVDIPGNTTTIQIQCIKPGPTGGILASADNGLKTDGTWTCSSDSGATWKPASFIPRKNYYTADHISDDAKVIWYHDFSNEVNSEDTTVFCKTDVVTCPDKDDLSAILLENNWRTQNEITAMSEEDKRNTVIVETEKMTGHTRADLEGRNNTGNLGSLTAIANMATLLVKYSIKRSSDVKTMTYQPHLRNSIIGEISQVFSMQPSTLHSKTDHQLLKMFCGQFGKSSSTNTSSTTASATTTAATTEGLLHTDANYEYYKVPVPASSKMTSAVVLTTCIKLGMKPQCFDASMADSNCVQAPSTSIHSYHPRGMSKILCSTNEPQDCASTLNMFWYMKDWNSGSACGATKGGLCSVGKYYTSTSDMPYFAACLKPVTTDWTIIQRRGQFGNAEDYFYKDFKDYEDGFGSVDGELWIGLKKLAALTKDGEWEWELQVDLTDWDDKKYHAKYGTFSVGPAPTYTLQVGGFKDGESTLGDSMGYHNEAAFSARDKDQDLASYSCALSHKGGWWYRSCQHANLNGLNFAEQKSNSIGLSWYFGKSRGNSRNTWKASVMKIKRVKV